MKTKSAVAGRAAPCFTIIMLAALGTAGAAEPVPQPLEAPPVREFSLVGTWYSRPRVMCGAASGLTFKSDGTYTHWVSLGLQDEGTYAHVAGVLKRNVKSCTFRGARIPTDDKPWETSITWIDAKHFRWGAGADAPTFARK